MRSDPHFFKNKLKEARKKQTVELFVPSLRRNLKFNCVTLEHYEKALDLNNKILTVGKNPEDPVLTDIVQCELILSCLADPAESVLLSAFDKPFLILQIRGLSNDKIQFDIDKVIHTKVIKEHVDSYQKDILNVLPPSKTVTLDTVAVKIGVPSLKKFLDYKNFTANIITKLTDEEVVKHLGQLFLIDAAQFIEEIKFGDTVFNPMDYSVPECVQIYEHLSIEVIKEIKVFIDAYQSTLNKQLEFKIKEGETVTLDLDVSFILNL